MTEVRTNGKLTCDELKRLLSYDPLTGVFIRKTSRGLAKKGTEAGHMKADGYRVIGVASGYFSAHRLAWLYMTGEWPADHIDHRNRNRADNRFANLRICNIMQNQGNKKALSASGFKGVYLNKGRWQAQIFANKTTRSLGRFDTPEEASNAYMRAAKAAFGEFARAK